MTLEDIERLIQMAQRRGLGEVHVSEGHATLILRARSSSLVSGRVTPKPITAPHAGVVRFSHPGASGPLVAAGAHVEEGAIVALLQVGFCFRPVIATNAGVVSGPLVEEGDLVGYGTPVMGYA